MLLDEKQIMELAKPFVGMVDSLVEFYNDPQNQKKYQEWYVKKYGCLPEER